MHVIDPAVLGELNERYSRVSGNVEFELLLGTTLVVIGTGASGGMIESFVRLGVKRLHLFDLDWVEAKNLAVQNFRHQDIGLPKTQALKRRLEECEFEKDNPAIPALKVITHGDFLAVSDDELSTLISEERREGRQVIFIMASDFHPVQARGSRIALAFDVPVFWVGIYRRGMAGEIVFYENGQENGRKLPCYRCIVAERYAHWDSHHLADHVAGVVKTGAGRSVGLPMAATFIDAILSHLVIGAIHKDVPDNPHGALYRRLLAEKRNFIQTQLDPTYRLGDEDIFAGVSGRDVVTFNTIFQQETPKPDCPDCGRTSGSIARLRGWRATDYTREVEAALF
ncbi:ThiF family adenylyltransferase [Azospirillum humicireducens]|nr:ThiF family adenylyltransferase [Azospirillum humicireducens]